MRVTLFVFSLLLAIPSLMSAESTFANQSVEALSSQEVRQEAKPGSKPQEKPAAKLPAQPATVAQAYRVQFERVRDALESDRIAGYKAGLTSKAGQKKFNVAEPLAGVLLGSGQRFTTQPISLSGFHKLMLETELGFRVSKPINQPLERAAQLNSHFDAVLPVIEMPDLAFSGKPTGIDLIASNVAAAGFIWGEPTSLDSFDALNQLKVVLQREHQVITKGRGGDAMGDQAQALLWLVNKLLAEGYRLQPGEILITGALGEMVPAQAGRHSADFEQLGRISFSIEP